MVVCKIDRGEGIVGLLDALVELPCVGVAQLNLKELNCKVACEVELMYVKLANNASIETVCEQCLRDVQ